MGTNNFREKANFIWSIADLLRGHYKQADYGKVILPFTVLRRLDSVLQPTNKSGTNEFFGVMWPSIKGTPSFLGKHYGKHSKPRVKYFDPDTCEIIEDEIPKCLVNIDSFSGTDDYDFLIECYSQEDNFLKQDISDSERERLIAIFREHSYQEFLKVAEENQQLKL